MTEDAESPENPESPDSTDDAEVDALGKLREALETVERARGRLYDFHQLTGHADLQLDDAVAALDACGLTEAAERVRTDLIGRNVIEGRWTFQVVEDYDDGYYAIFQRVEREIRDEHGGGRHDHESRLKDRRRTPGRRGHERRPDQP